MSAAIIIIITPPPVRPKSAQSLPDQIASAVRAALQALEGPGDGVEPSGPEDRL